MSENQLKQEQENISQGYSEDRRIVLKSLLDGLTRACQSAGFSIAGFIIIKDKEKQLSFRCARDAQKHTLDSSYI